MSDEEKLSKNDSNDLDGQLLLDLGFENSYWKPSKDLTKSVDNVSHISTIHC